MGDLADIAAHGNPGLPGDVDGDATVEEPTTKPTTLPTTRPATKPATMPDYPNKGEALDAGIANKAIALKNVRGCILRDFSIFEGGHFAILATGVDGLTIDNVKIDTNRDGMDIDCCRNVRVCNCSVNSPHDDAIVLKSTYALGYVRDTQNVTIANCMVSGGYVEGSMLDGTFRKFAPADCVDVFNHYYHVQRIGRIKLGTESNGGFKNVAISNCLFDNCEGLAIESVDGGVIDNVTVSNLAMRDLVSSPLYVRLGSRLRASQGDARRRHPAFEHRQHRRAVCIGAVRLHHQRDSRPRDRRRVHSRRSVDISRRGLGIVDPARAVGAGDRLSRSDLFWRRAGLRVLPPAHRRAGHDRRGDELCRAGRSPAVFCQGRSAFLSRSRDRPALGAGAGVPAV